MFDLMYANQQYGAQYAFLRSNKKENLLIAVNFDDVSADVQLTLPAHAFDYLDLKEQTCKAVDLLTSESRELTLQRDAQVTITLPPRNGVVYKF
jgi:arginine utilization protein RocB